GLELADPGHAGRAARRAFELGLLVETAGARDEVVKLLPPLTVTADDLDEGLRTVQRAVHETA
ncbi:diaminobutyrate--2-oxoglutarate transaminase, partial [Streptomyces sp. SID2131]|nr:diaminobutyrate--2-oxoglutarate transaminase [Streptomyces sp. SID2131]